MGRPSVSGGLCYKLPVRELLHMEITSLSDLFDNSFKREAYRGSEFAPRILADEGIPVIMKVQYDILGTGIISTHTNVYQSPITP